jgi:hypothetical protein
MKVVVKLGLSPQWVVMIMPILRNLTSVRWNMESAEAGA